MPNLDLPIPGVTPGPEWATKNNAALNALNDVMETGRLSPEGLSDEIVAAAADLNPEALSSAFVLTQVRDPGAVNDAVTKAAILSNEAYDSRANPNMQAANGNSSVNAGPVIQQFLQDAVSLGYSHVRIVGQFWTTSRVTIPNDIVGIELGKGSRIKAVTGGMFEKRGTLVFKEGLASGYSIPLSQFDFTPQDSTKYTAGERILIGSRVPLSGTSGNFPGWIREVTSVGPTSIGLDLTLPRTAMPKAGGSVMGEPDGVLVFGLQLAKPIRFSGAGRLEGAGFRAPVSTDETLISLTAVYNPVFEGGIEVSDHSRSLISITHCVDGYAADAHIHRAYDDGGNGYGFSINGATQGFVIDRTCLVEDVRHSSTTNTGPETGPQGFRVTGSTNNAANNYGAIGEPESNDFNQTANRCSNKSVDSHRLGWGNRVGAKVLGGGAGGIQVRADNTLIIGATVFGTRGPGIAVESVVQVATKIKSVVVDSVRNPGSGQGILALGPAQIDNATVRGINDTSFAIEVYDNTRGKNIRIEDSGRGVWFRGNNSVLEAETEGTVTELHRTTTGKYGNRLILAGASNYSKGSTQNYSAAPASTTTGASMLNNYFDAFAVDLPPGRVVNMAVRVSTPQADAKMRLGLYDCLPDGTQGPLIMEAGTATTSGGVTTYTPADLSTSGEKVLLFDGSGVTIGGGRYFLGALMKAPGTVPSMYRHTLSPSSQQSPTQSRSQFIDAAGNPVYRDINVTADALPATIPTSVGARDSVRITVGMIV